MVAVEQTCRLDQPPFQGFSLVYLANKQCDGSGQTPSAVAKLARGFVVFWGYAAIMYRRSLEYGVAFVYATRKVRFPSTSSLITVMPYFFA